MTHTEYMIGGVPVSRRFAFILTHYDYVEGGGRRLISRAYHQKQLAEDDARSRELQALHESKRKTKRRVGNKAIVPMLDAGEKARNIALGTEMAAKAPKDHKWCAYREHYVHIDDYGRQKSRCKACNNLYQQEYQRRRRSMR